MRAPAIVRVLGQSVHIEYVGVSQNIYSEHGRPHVQTEGATRVLGCTEEAVQRIAIRDGQGFHQERSTVIHELIHLIQGLTGHGVDDWNSDAGKERHALIQALETGLLDALRSNPALIEYLTEPL